MTSQNGTDTRSSKAAIKELIAGRTKVLEKLAGQLEKVDQARAAVTAAQQNVDQEAAAAREIYQQALDAGWAAAELAGAGLKPPAPPRKRTTPADAPTATDEQ